jgi:putative surface-exposed virulence protein
MKRKRVGVVGLLLALLVASVPAQPTYADTITVDTTDDVRDAAASCNTVTITSLPGPDGVTSLREAMCAANNNSGPDSIHFNIPGCGGVCTIQPTIALPILTDDGTTINGYSQPGTAEASDGTPATLLIEIDGTDVENQNGFNITSGGNMIRGLAINHFGGIGVAIGGSTAVGNIISGNHIGTDASGSLGRGNGLGGVFIAYGATNNTIGGDTPAERNVISGNDWAGVAIYSSGTLSNTISANYIGVDANGTGDLGNSLNGIYIYGGAQANTVGGDTQGERNVISGNDRYGVRISGSHTMSNTVCGNYIGPAANGSASLANANSGVEIDGGAQNNTIGGDTQGERNVISGNDEHGVLISGGGTTGNTVCGNYIGTAANGTDDLGNSVSGVVITAGAQNNRIGGDTQGERNVISGNDHSGIEITNTDTMSNTVCGNYIGTDKDGAADLGNTFFGVNIGWGAQNNVIGGDTEGERNVISGNDMQGIRIHDSNTRGNTISGNYIGIAADGTGDLGNGLHGVDISDGAQNNTVGGDAQGERNVISGNDRSGVHIWGSGTTANTIRGNYIGTDASGTADRGNSEHGVYITDGAQSNTVGGDTPDERNVISGNVLDGIVISRSDTMGNTVCGNYIGTAANGTGDLGNAWRGIRINRGAQNNTVGPGNIIAHSGYDGVEVTGIDTTGNTVTQNSIFSNDMGIYLRDGANGGIAAPVIVATSVGSVNIVGTACPGCSVEVFENGDSDGEGETYVGTTTADAGGDFTLTIGSLSDPYLTATATDGRGTSEFSAVFTATVPLTPDVSPTYLPIILKNR